MLLGEDFCLGLPWSLWIPTMQGYLKQTWDVRFIMKVKEQSSFT